MNNDLAKIQSELYKAQQRLNQFEDRLLRNESLKRAFCIKNRNEVHTSELRKDFAEQCRAMGRKAPIQPLDVFCVSAQTYFGFLGDRNSANIPPGFLSKADTNIPSLKEWLIQTTLPKRERNADDFLQSIVRFEISLRPWVASKAIDYKLSPEQSLALSTSYNVGMESLSGVSLLPIPLSISNFELDI